MLSKWFLLQSSTSRQVDFVIHVALACPFCPLVELQNVTIITRSIVHNCCPELVFVSKDTLLQVSSKCNFRRVMPAKRR